MQRRSISELEQRQSVYQVRSADGVQCGGKDMETLEGNMCSSAVSSEPRATQGW
jgi:hypothetical protein